MTVSVQPPWPGPATQATPRRVHRRPVLIALMTSMALAAMDTTIVSTAIPQVVRDLGGFSLFSWVFSSYLLTQTVTIPVQGRLADQWGRKPVLIAGILIFLAGLGAVRLLHHDGQPDLVPRAPGDRRGRGAGHREHAGR